MIVVVKEGLACRLMSFIYVICLGIKVTTKCHGEVTCKAMLLFTVTDLPAKAMLLNCHQYNGEYGCQTCKHKGKQVMCLIESHIIALVV